MFTPRTDIGIRIEADYKRLRDLSSELTTFIAQNVASEHFTAWKLSALTRLRDFQNQLAKHFDLEEDGGFIDELLGLSPESSNWINDLREDHRRMLEDLASIIAMVKSYSLPGDLDLPQLRSRINTFLVGLREHESAETALLYDAHFQVNGAGD